MEITTSYTVALKAQMKSTVSGKKKSADEFTGEKRISDDLMRSTADECLAAYRTCADAFLESWNRISTYPVSAKKGVISRRRFGDLLIHSTKNSHAEYPKFDKDHGSMPSYMRRAIIADVIGSISSFMSNHKNWETADPEKCGAEPAFGYPSSYELTFYRQDRETSLLENGIIGVKLYDGKSWDWHYFRISMADARFICRLCRSRKMLSPVIEKKGHRWLIRFSFSENAALTEKKPLEQSILAVDLGIISPASWCVMESGGTVRARGIIHLAREEDRLRHLMNRSRKYQQAGKKSHCVYRMMNAANKQLSVDTTRALIKIAEKYDVDCIVFEHLDTSGKKHGRTKQRLHMWRCRDVQKRVELQAHRRGMRISRVCAWGTSRLAFDGSGPVKRGKAAGEGVPYNISIFSTGKQYNCDLGASMNIGARYFLRAIADEYENVKLPATPQRTLSDLIGVANARHSSQN